MLGKYTFFTFTLPAVSPTLPADLPTLLAVLPICDKEGKVKIYDGETARNINVRSKEHIKDFKNNHETSFMLKHINKEHNGDKEHVKFSFKVLRKHKKPFKRQKDEAVNMNRMKPAEKLNTKYEIRRGP